jgi:hypothetical protein
VKSLVQLLEAVMQDCMAMSGANLARDIQTLHARAENEGDSFIAITLPNFCRDFERSLDGGRVDPGSFLHFRKVKGSPVPAFLQGLMFRVFDRQGTILAEPSTDCIRFVRQICLYGKKIARECSKERIRAAVDGYVRCENEIVPPDRGTAYTHTWCAVSTLIVDSLRLEEASVLLKPRHGPGQTRERISGNQKYVFRRWHKRLCDPGFTWAQYGRFSEEIHPEEEVSPPVLVEPGSEAPVRVVFVPKTQKTPRVIAVEPVCMQYVQQGLSRELVGGLERSPYTAGHVIFDDQTVNQALAMAGSVTGEHATLDMSEASDRVSMAQVELMLEGFPNLLESWKACRSTRAELPDGRTIDLKKFASMGSALCFPVESLIFFISIIASRLVRAEQVPTRRSVLDAARGVYVFGDDLIVPADEAQAICEDLEAFGFRVNVHKSFWTGRFRESCGTDCYAGVEVTPVYLRCDLPSSDRDASALISSVATANQLYSRGFVRASTAIKEVVEKILGPLPQVSEASAAIGWTHHSDATPDRRWNRDYQRREERFWVPHSPKQDDPLDGDAALVKCSKSIGSNLLSSPRLSAKEVLTSLWEWIEGFVAVAEDHLKMSPRPYALTLKRRWIATHLQGSCGVLSS